MKVTLVTNTSLPGGFVIEAENPAECLLLRNFANWPSSTREPHRLFLANHGGNIAENVQSMMIHWRKESDFTPPNAQADAPPK
jgi:hypothetical protein